MKKLVLLFFFVFSFVLVMAQLLAAEEDSTTNLLPPTLVTLEILNSKIAEVEASTDFNDEAKSTLVGLYRKALSNLQKAVSDAEAAESFRLSAEKAPLELQVLNEELIDGRDRNPPKNTVDVDMSSPLRQIEQLLQTEKANFAAAEATLAAADRQLEVEMRRPVLIQQRLIESQKQLQDVDRQLKLPPSDDEGPITTEAMQWVLETHYQALSTEIKMLDQELLTQPVLLDLLKIKRDIAAEGIGGNNLLINHLEDLVTEKREEDAGLAKIQAATIRREAEGKHPMIKKLSEQNAVLSEEVASMVSQLDDLAQRTEFAVKLVMRIEDDFESEREIIEIGGLSQEMGHMLLQRRNSLPELKLFKRQANEREETVAQIGVQRLRHRHEQKKLRDLHEYVAGLTAGNTFEEKGQLSRQLHKLAEKRRELLVKAIETDDFYLRKLGELESVQKQLLLLIESYDQFLKRHLLWVRSTTKAELEALGALPEQVWQILSPKGWGEVMHALTHQVRHSRVFVLFLFAFGVLLWGRKRMLEAIQNTGRKIGKPPKDRFGYSVQVLALSLIVAVAWPLLMIVNGWQLRVSLEGTDFSNSVGRALIFVAIQFYLLRAFRMLCIQGGLGDTHFRWPKSNLKLLRNEMDRLSWIYLPAAMVTTVAFYLDPLNIGWAIGRISLMILVIALAFTFYRSFHPKSGIFGGYINQPERQTYRRLHRIWYPLLIATPLALGILAIMGYILTAGTLLKLLIESVWLFVGLGVVEALAHRWLRVTRRKLAYEAALDHRPTILEGRSGEKMTDSTNDILEMEMEEPEIDLGALSDTSRKLFNTATISCGLIGLWVIWSEVFPALSILNDIVLWHHRVTVDGQVTRIPTSLADIGLALIFVTVTVVLVKQLPAIIEIILLHRFSMSASNRYTIIALTTYAIITLGVISAFNTIGAQWSQLQWLVAALSIGIGFGLQEIVANFISGLIILFERPIRVGDIITVGDTDGIVTKIRIRATTIRNWDRKELLVPNKEFITGRLLNWSLSDQVTRLMINVGVAYGTDVDKAHDLMMAVAQENEDVLDDPAPVVSFEAFGDNSLALVLRSYIDDLDKRVFIITALHKEINRKFEQAGIVIAFPQCDMHVDIRKPLPFPI